VQVLYIDTERKFSARRLVELAATRAGAGVFDGDALAARVLVVAPAGAPELLALLQGLEAAVIERGVRLVVVDSIAALARAGFGAAQLPERQQALGAPRPPCGPTRPGPTPAPAHQPPRRKGGKSRHSLCSASWPALGAPRARHAAVRQQQVPGHALGAAPSCSEAAEQHPPATAARRGEITRRAREHHALS